MKKIAVMTGGGDCPGLNAVIRAVVRSGLSHGFETFGIHNGWQGLIEGELEPLTDISVSGITTLGGTILGTSRIDPLKKPRRCGEDRKYYPDVPYRRVGSNWRKRDALSSA